MLLNLYVWEFGLREHLKLRAEVGEVPHNPAFVKVLVGLDGLSVLHEVANKAPVLGVLGVDEPPVLLEFLQQLDLLWA